MTTSYDDLILTMKASAMSGIISRSLLHPIDTIKSKRQSVASNVSIASLVKQTYQSGGVREFYKGFGIAASGSIPGVCLYFTSFHIFQGWLKRAELLPSPVVDFSAGFLAEAVSCVFWVPVDVSKEQLQVQSNLGRTNFRHAREALLVNYRNQGLRGIYKGYNATLASFGPFSAFYFAFVEAMKPHVNKDFSSLVGVCALSGALASFITTPLDTVKVMMQVGTVNKGTIEALKSVHKLEGFKGLFRGSVPRVAFFATNTAVTMGSMEWLKVRLSSQTKD